ncbi:BA75_04710T0 [Komagataella pastoris]|uniref:BA75_04710T0 n=1 Tax=Komagataella pastoris TaxID=4922 RepID=A0A1B2JHP2_PICPA|nr:BA75_04710T0 [Komagataella pastoris]
MESPEQQLVLQSYPGLQFFAIFNPKLQCNEEDPSSSDLDETESELKRKLLCFITFDGAEISNFQKFKLIGMIEGLQDFSSKFRGGNKLRFIDTQKSRLILLNVEQDYWLVLSIRLAEVKVSATNEKIFTLRFLALPEYTEAELQDGYRWWRLHNGEFSFNYKQLPLESFTQLLEDWWYTWCKNKWVNFEIKNEGFVDVEHSFRKSSIELPNGFTDSLEANLAELMSEDSDLLDVIIMNTTKTPIKNFGVLWKNKDSKFEQESLVDLIRYQQCIALSVGLTTNNLSEGNVLSPSEVDPTSPEEEHENLFYQIANQSLSFLEPSKNFLTTQLGNILYPATMTLDAMSSISGYLPEVSWFYNKGETPSSVEVPQAQENTENTPDTKVNEKKGKYLIGMVKLHTNTEEKEICDKLVFLKQKNEPTYMEHKLLIYEVAGLTFTAIYRGDCSSLNEPDYYRKVEDSLYKVWQTCLYRLVLENVKEYQSCVKSKLSTFYYLLYDQPSDSHQSSFPIISFRGSDEDFGELDSDVFSTLTLKDNETVKGSILNSTSKPKNAKEISKSQLISLNQSILSLSTESRSEQDILLPGEKLLKTGRNWWILFKDLGESQAYGTSLIIARKFDSKDPSKKDVFNNSDSDDNLVSSLGEDVSEWWENFTRSV